MLFWILAAIGLALATFVCCLPLFRKKSGWTPIALALVFAVPAATLMLYQEVGTPRALDAVKSPARPASNNPTADTAEIDELVNNLRSRLTEDSASLDGWILLARTLKSMQRYPEAMEALETANRIDPDNALVAVELVETRIFLSPQGRIDGEMVAMLQAALTADPGQQKALWLLGIAASQAGEDEAAISYWETLLQQLDPESTITSSVKEQISMAQNRLGMEGESDAGAAAAPAEMPAPAKAPVETAENAVSGAAAPVVDGETPGRSGPSGADGSWSGTNLRVSMAAESLEQIPSAAVLWIMIRTPGPAAGPPLGVRRVISPSLPLEITISDADSMMKERLISSQTELQLQARLSLSGAPQARSGDWQSHPVDVSLDSTETLELMIDQRVE